MTTFSVINNRILNRWRVPAMLGLTGFALAAHALVIAAPVGVSNAMAVLAGALLACTAPVLNDILAASQGRQPTGRVFSFPRRDGDTSVGTPASDNRRAA
ncbi:MAG: hypothetical protein GC149_19385 [Gammaproteobacteria bacterium]|nr:hypothetical protein [Gammaproteobacteria bacterium]